MATPLKVISAALIGSGSVERLAPDQAINVEAFDLIDMAIAVQFDTTNSPAIIFYSSMDRSLDDLTKATTKWLKVGTLSAASFPTPGVYRYTIPDTSTLPAFLGRWLRWEITSGSGGCMVDADGMGRRKCA